MKYAYLRDKPYAQVVFGTMVDQIRSVVLLVLVNYFILALWRVFGRPTILMSLGTVGLQLDVLAVAIQQSEFIIDFRWFPCGQLVQKSFELVILHSNC